jgi:hypothetical protein
VLVVCPKTGEHLLVIEVRSSHSIGEAKRAAYEQSGLPWLEVSALHTIQRFRRAPLCPEDWGSRRFPSPPTQSRLFSDLSPSKVQHSSRGFVTAASVLAVTCNFTDRLLDNPLLFDREVARSDGWLTANIFAIRRPRAVSNGVPRCPQARSDRTAPVLLTRGPQV